MTGPYPSRTLRGEVTLYRIHRAVNGPWWFSADGFGRFDPVGTGFGACYFALEPLGAFLEVFRKTQIIDEADIHARRLFSVQLGADQRLVNLLARRGLAVGITAALGANQDYTESHRLAVAAVSARYAGVRYHVSHDPAQKLIGIALFGAAGTVAGPSGTHHEIPSHLIIEAERLFGYRVLPAP